MFSHFSYDEEVRKREGDNRYSSPLGIMCQSEFAKIPNKNIIHLSPPDTMHDIMEGILPEVCRAILKESLVKVTDLNHRIKEHDWVNDQVKIESDFKVIGKALQVS